MTNGEKNKDEIWNIICSGEEVSVDKRTNKPCKCRGLLCKDCALMCKIMSHSGALAFWLNSEYEEPCEFEKDELVEVSNNGRLWELRYFSHIDEKDIYRKFATFVYGKTSKENPPTINWIHCRKYGTLGRLVKGE